MRIPLAVGLAGLIITSSLYAGEKPPNVILVLADDLGANELTCYGSKKGGFANCWELTFQRHFVLRSTG